MKSKNVAHDSTQKRARNVAPGGANQASAPSGQVSRWTGQLPVNLSWSAHALFTYLWAWPAAHLASGPARELVAERQKKGCWFFFYQRLRKLPLRCIQSPSGYYRFDLRQEGEMWSVRSVCVFCLLVSRISKKKVTHTHLHEYLVKDRSQAWQQVIKGDVSCSYSGP